MLLSVFLDIEDCVTPLSDDIALDLAVILSRHGVVSNSMVVGDKARTLEQRGRGDVIAALRQHEIGLHTDRHSRHPNVSEYLADKGWEDGIEEAVLRESPGVRTLERVFGKPPFSWGQSGGSWGPQIHPAVRRLGLGPVVYPWTYTETCDIHWYGSSLTFGYRNFVEGFDTAYSDDAEFAKVFGAAQEQIDRHIRARTPWLGLFAGHPIYIRAYEFGDVLNFERGRESQEPWVQPELKSEAEYAVALKNFEKLIRWLAEHPRIEVGPLSSAAACAAEQPTSVGLSDLADYAKEAAEDGGIYVESVTCTPAEATDLMCRVLSTDSPVPEPLPVRQVYGPLKMPPETGAVSIDAGALREASHQVAGFVDRHESLPASVQLADQEVGIGTFYRALCRAFPGFIDGNDVGATEIAAGSQLPALADHIAENTEKDFRGWVIHPEDLDTRRLLELTRLQTWTLRPAALSL